MNQYIYEYIWQDKQNNFRSKTKVYTEKHGSSLRNLITPSVESIVPLWNFDGSSTEQADGSDSEVYIKPVSIYKDPFRKNMNSYLVLCETYLPNGEPHPDNKRQDALNIFENETVKKEKPMFGIEQEFFFMDKKTGSPLGFEPSNSNKETPKQGQYYCGVGAGNCFGRNIADHVLANALYCELNITGLNFEVAPGQCELQLCDTGIKASDDLLLLRYLLVRTAENYNVGVEFHPKPVKGDWNGSGCHTNYSTKSMREKNGYDKIMEAIHKLEKKHKEHIEVYGEYNDERLTGKHETASMERFSYGVADRGSSIRIPRFTHRDKKGYLEDRRPGSNMNPYLVTSKIVETTLL
jgi:glutamine synthetase